MLPKLCVFFENQCCIISSEVSGAAKKAYLLSGSLRTSIVGLTIQLRISEVGDQPPDILFWRYITQWSKTALVTSVSNF